MFNVKKQHRLALPSFHEVQPESASFLNDVGLGGSFTATLLFYLHRTIRAITLRLKGLFLVVDSGVFLFFLYHLHKNFVNFIEKI